MNEGVKHFFHLSEGGVRHFFHLSEGGVKHFFQPFLGSAQLADKVFIAMPLSLRLLLIT